MHIPTLGCVALASAFMAVPALAATYRVGTGTGCTHATIQAAVDAAAVTATADEIHVSQSQAYTQQTILIDQAQGALVLGGGYATCLADTPGAGQRTVISGASPLPVLRIRRSRDVHLQDLDIRDGHAAGFGGGLDITGSGGAVVLLGNTWVRGNQANTGGGISISNTDAAGDPADVQLLLFGDSAVVSNTANSGGGIFCARATLQVFDHGHVSLNTASGGYGGGIHAQDCRVKLGSSGLAGAVLWANAAPLASGGGLYVAGPFGEADLYTVDPAQPLRVVGNSAYSGAAIALSADARVAIYDGIIEDNVASGAGGAIFVYPGTGAHADTRFLMQGTTLGAPPAAVNCAVAEACNRIRGNSAEGVGGMRMPGAAIVVDAAVAGSAHVTLRGTRLDGNVGASLAHHADDHGQISFDGALLDGNFVDGPLLDAPGSANSLVLAASTVAYNSIGLGRAVIGGVGSCDIASDYLGTHVYRSIVWQPGHNLIALASPAQVQCFQYVIGNQFGGVPPSSNLVVADPAFVDAAHGDFRPGAASPVLDFAPAQPANSTRDRGVRVVDLPGDGDQFGPQDLGAYEIRAERIFVDGFDPP
jgi:hypothetical protein